jgi:hypothetical protein
MSITYPTLSHAARPGIASSLVTAASVTILVAGHLAVCLFLGSWAIAGLLGLPLFMLVALWIVSGGISAAIAVIMFVRVMRIEARLADHGPIEDIGWHPFAT